MPRQILNAIVHEKSNLDFWTVIEPSGEVTNYDLRGEAKMKTLTGLDQKPVLIDDTTDEKILESIPTFRKMLKIVAGNSQPKAGTDESIDLFQIGLKLKGEGDVQLEDADFKLLQSKTKDNPANFTSHILGQILLKFKDAEKAAEKK
jgi:hypothetical protein